MYTLCTFQYEATISAYQLKLYRPSKRLKSEVRSSNFLDITRSVTNDILSSCDSSLFGAIGCYHNKLPTKFKRFDLYLVFGIDLDKYLKAKTTQISRCIQSRVNLCNKGGPEAHLGRGMLTSPQCDTLAVSPVRNL